MNDLPNFACLAKISVGSSFACEIAKEVISVEVTMMDINPSTT